MIDSLLRWVLGPTFNAARSAHLPSPDPDTPPKIDPTIEIVSTDDEAWTVSLNVPAYDTATHSKLAEARIYLLANGSGRPGSAAEYASSSYPFASVDLSGITEGREIVVPLPEVGPADYFGQVILGFDDSPDSFDPAPLPPNDASPAGELEPPTTG